ncbi:hypothetical protein EDB19DRAFT_90971 [Suillus lakei]|nr:hypothetical protein EDB19DRAFT_90971 [Suillus lakei]
MSVSSILAHLVSPVDKLPNPEPDHKLASSRAIAAGKLTIAEGVELKNFCLATTHTSASASDSTDLAQAPEVAADAIASSTAPGGSQGNDPHPTDTSAPLASGDFVAECEIPLFGNNSVKAELLVWHGPPPAGVVIGQVVPSVQKALVTGDFKLSSIIPVLKGTEFDDITFRNVTIIHQNYQFDPSSALGYSFYGDLVIEQSCGAIYNILRKVLGLEEPVLHVHADFGPDQAWSSPVSVSALTIEGAFTGSTPAPTTGIAFTSIGARLEMHKKSDSVASYFAMIHGKMNLAVPGAITPLELDYTLSDTGGTIKLDASIPNNVQWQNPMGVQGISLDNATFSSNLTLDDPWKYFTLDIDTHFTCKSMKTEFRGSWVTGGACAISANMSNFDFQTIEALYGSMHHASLNPPKIDVSIASAVISIAKGQGLTVSLQGVGIAGHQIGDANLVIDSDGVNLHGGISNGETMNFGSLVLSKALINVNYCNTASGKQTDATITGNVLFHGLEFEAAVHLYHSADDTNTAIADTPMLVEWTVFAELTANNDQLLLSKFVPAVRGSKLDLALSHVVFLAASRDHPDIGVLIPTNYSFHKGVQICGTFDGLPVLNALTHSTTTGLFLNAGYDPSSGFSLDIQLPVLTRLHLGHGITSTGLELRINQGTGEIGSPGPTLSISSGLLIPVAHSEKPLEFEMMLTGDVVEVSGSIELKGWWVDPFGISKEVKIGPLLMLQITVSCTLPTAPSGLAFSGGLQIGNTTADVIVSIDEDPMKQMVSAEVKNLNLDDIVTFTEKIIGSTISKPPSGFLLFQDLKLYICPLGATLAGVAYPPGFSYESRMIIFGHHADISGHIGSGGLSIQGDVDNFRIGPLIVHGNASSKEPSQATIKCVISETVQHLSLNGEVILWDDSVAINLEVDTHPVPEVVFFCKLKFTDSLFFELKATLIGAPSFTDLSKSDFEFYADFEEPILDHIGQEVAKCFDKAEKETKGGMEAAQKKVEDERKAMLVGIDKAQKNLDAAKVAWDKKNQSASAAAALEAASDEIAAAARDVVIELMESSEYAAYHLAVTGLAVAKEATTGLKAAEQILSSVERAAEGILSALSFIDNEGTKTLDIQKIILTGSLGKTPAGPQSLSADIQGVVIGNAFHIQGKLDPRKVEDFIADIFTLLLDEIKLHGGKP